MIESGNGFGFKMVVDPEIYKTGGFYDPEYWLEIDSDISFLRGKLEVFPPNKILRSSPVNIISKEPLFVEDLKSHFEKINEAYSRIAPTIFSEIKNARILRNVIYTPRENNFDIIYETFRPNDRLYLAIASREEIENAVHLEDVDLETIWLGSVGSANYGHWLVDDLPRAIWISSKAPGSVRILISSYGEHIDEIKRQSLVAFIGHDNFELKFIDINTNIIVNKLNYISPISYHPVLKSQHALTDLRARISAKFNYNKRKNRRLFVSREIGSTREIINWAEIEPEIKKMGFEIIYPGKMSFYEQAILFCEASVVVGIMGAAMTNTVFCPPGTPVCYLAPTGWSEPFYWDLASMMDHPYTAVFGAPDQSGDIPPYMCNFRVEPELLAEAIVSLEKRRYSEI